MEGDKRAAEASEETGCCSEVCGRLAGDKGRQHREDVGVGTGVVGKRVQQRNALRQRDLAAHRPVRRSAAQDEPNREQPPRRLCKHHVQRGIFFSRINRCLRSPPRRAMLAAELGHSLEDCDPIMHRHKVAINALRDGFGNVRQHQSVLPCLRLAYHVVVAHMVHEQSSRRRAVECVWVCVDQCT